MREFILVAVFTSAFLGSPFLHAAERQLATLQGLTAVVQDDFCSSNAAIRVIAPDASEFSGDKINLQRLIGAIRVPLSMECPSARALTINGEVNGQQVYQGYVAEADEWALKDTGNLALSNKAPQPLNKQRTDEQFKAEMLEKIWKLRQDNNKLIGHLDKEKAEADAAVKRADENVRMAEETRAEMEKNAITLSNGQRGFLSRDGTTFETLDGKIITDSPQPIETKKGIEEARRISGIYPSGAKSSTFRNTSKEDTQAEQELKMGEQLARVGNNFEAFKWFKKAADKNNAEAEYKLGVMYDKGLGIDQDPILGSAYFNLAAVRGHAEAMNNFGNMYEEGRGVQQSYSSAIEWYSKAAEAGNAMAHYNLGILNLDGRGVPKNTDLAIEHFRMADNLGGVPEARRMISLIMRKRNR